MTLHFLCNNIHCTIILCFFKPLLLFSAKYGVLESGDLYIRDTTDHDGSYSFRCHTENTVTKDKKVSMNYSRIIVTGKYIIVINYLLGFIIFYIDA